MIGYKLIANVKHFVFKKGIVKDVVVLTFGSLLAQTIMVLIMPILSRLYLPSDFGLLAVFIAASTVISTLITLRYEINLLIPRSSIEARCLLHLCFALAVVLGLVVVVCVCLMPISVLYFVKLGELDSWLVLVCFVAIVISMNSIAFYWLNRCKQYKKIAVLRTLQSIAFAVAASFFGIVELKNGLLLAQIIAFTLLFFLIVRYIPICVEFNCVGILVAAKKYSSTPKYALPSALLDVITTQLPIVLIGVWYGSAEAGQFNLAWRVLVLPSSIIGIAIGQVFFQRFAALWPDSGSAMSLLKKTWFSLGFFGIFPMLIFIFLGDEIFSFVFGSQWSPAGQIAALLSPMIFASFIHSPTSVTSTVLGLQKNVFVFSLFILLYRPFAIYLGVMFDDFYFGLSMYVVLEIFQIILFQSYIYKKLKTQSTYKRGA